MAKNIDSVVLVTLAEQVIADFNGGMVKEPVPISVNGHGYITHYRPVEAMCSALPNAFITIELKHEVEIERLREVAMALDKALGGMLTFYVMDEEPREVSGVVYEAARKARVQYAAVLGEAR